MVWNPNKDNEVICEKCGTRYRVEGDSVMVYWLSEITEYGMPYKTDPRY